MSRSNLVPSPENFDFAAAFQAAVKEAFAPAAELRRLKEAPYLTARDVEILYGVPYDTLKKWRKKRIGPIPFRLGGGRSPHVYSHEEWKKFFELQQITDEKNLVR
ncbi:MAG: hypothetical protein LBP61_09240 [Desulfovibrio sp.]|jgi:hypothetical protein|nr:hypothetical protein [Desulfovibrio sp.]